MLDGNTMSLILREPIGVVYDQQNVLPEGMLWVFLLAAKVQNHYKEYRDRDCI